MNTGNELNQMLDVLNNELELLIDLDLKDFDYLASV